MKVWECRYLSVLRPLEKENGMKMSENTQHSLAEPYFRKVGRMKFKISTFDNPYAEQTAQKLVLEMLAEKITAEQQSDILDRNEAAC